MVSGKPYFLLGLFLLGAAVIGGCGGYANISGRDNSVFFPCLRVNVPILDKDDMHGRSDHAVEAEVSRGKGAGRQSLASGALLFAGTTFSGPAEIHQDYTLSAADLLLRFRFPREAWSFIEFLAGLRYTDLDLRLRSGSLSAQGEFTGTNLASGIGMGFRLSDDLILDFRYVIDFNDREDRMHSREVEVSYWLSQHMAMTAGYRQWQYSRSRPGESDINELTWTGFSGGLSFSF